MIRKSTAPYDGGDIAIFVPESGHVLFFQEGSGENIFPEEQAEGYVDYVNYSVYKIVITYGDDCFEHPEFVEGYGDGGSVMFKKNVTDMTLGEVASEVLLFAGEKPEHAAYQMEVK